MIKILLSLSLDLSEIGTFGVTFIAVGRRMGSALMPIEGLFLLPASIQAQIIVKGIRRNETTIIKTVTKKPLRH